MWQSKRPSNDIGCNSMNITGTIVPWHHRLSSTVECCKNMMNKRNKAAHDATYAIPNNRVTPPRTHPIGRLMVRLNTLTQFASS